MTASAVHVVGSINEDVRLLVRAHPEPGETVTALEAEVELGGKGANQAVAARRAGAPVRFVGAVGSDTIGTSLREALEAEGIDVTGIDTAETAMTGRAIVTVAESGENEIVVVPGANATVDAKRVRRELSAVASGDVVLLQLELPLPIVAVAASEARRRGAFVIVNAAPMHVNVLSIMENVDLLVVNETELAALLTAEGVDTAAADSRRAAQGLAERLATRVLCTFGAGGSLLAGAGPQVAARPKRVDATDTTGAGDAYIGYVAAAITAGRSWAGALDIATAAAALTVTRPGAARSIPTMAETEADIDSPQSAHGGTS